MNCIRQWFIVLILFSCFSVYAQDNELKFSKTGLPEVFQTIEQRTSWVFNYDPDLVAPYSYSGRLLLDDPKVFVRALFKETPLDFEVLGKNILVVLPDPEVFQICGTIRSESDQTSLPFANIAAEGLSLGTQTNENGFFEFSVEGRKNQAIQISFIGYLTKRLLIDDWQPGKCKEIFLEVDENLFDGEIIIRDYLLPGVTEGKAYGGVEMDFKLLSKNNITQEYDILKTAQLIPGITSIDESSANLHIRGATPDHNLILWEGATLYDPGHVFGMISSINPFVVNQMDIYKGVFDPKFDSRIGGIIDISLGDEIPEKPQFGFGSTLTEAHAYVNVPIIKDKLSFLFSGRNTIYDIFNSPTLNSYTQKVFQATKVEDGRNEAEGEEDFLEINEDLKFYDFNTKLIFEPNDQLSFKLATFTSSNEYLYNFTAFEEDLTTDDQVDFNAFGLSSSLDIKWNEKESTNLKFIWSDYRNNFSFSITEEFEELPFYQEAIFNDILDLQFGISHAIALNQNLEVDFGYNYDHKEVNYNITESSIFDNEFAERQFGSGTFHNVFGSFSLKGEQFQLNAGSRFTYYTNFNRSFFSPRINFQRAMTDRLKLKISAGRFYQFISRIQRFNDGLNANSNLWILSNEQVESILVADKLAFGFVYNHKGWLFDLEFYQNRTKGIPSLTTSLLKGIEIDGTGSGDARGMDFLARKRWKNYQLWFNYALSDNEYFFPSIQDGAFPASNNQIHKFSIVNNWSVKNWNFTLTYQFNSGLPFSEPTGIIEFADEDEPELDLLALDFEDINDQKLPDYHRLDFGLAYRVLLMDKVQAEFSLSIINLLNRNNIFTRDYFLGELEDEEDQEAEPEIGSFFIEKSLLQRTPLFMFRVYW